MKVLRHNNKATSDMTIEELKEVASFYCIKDYRKIEVLCSDGSYKTIDDIIKIKENEILQDNS